MIDKNKIKIGKSKASADWPQVLPAESTDWQYKSRYYDIDTGKLMSLDFIKGRIEKSFSKVRKLTVEMAFDWHFIFKHQTDYDLEGNVQEWADKNLPISRAYRFDIIKSIDLLLENGGEKPFEELILDAMNHFDNIGVGKLKLAAQIENQEDKKEVIQDLKEGKEIKTAEILAKNRGKKIPVVKNQYGLDVGYFRHELSALNKSLVNIKPDELYNQLCMLADQIKRILDHKI